MLLHEITLKSENPNCCTVLKCSSSFQTDKSNPPLLWILLVSLVHQTVKTVEKLWQCLMALLMWDASIPIHWILVNYENTLPWSIKCKHSAELIWCYRASDAATSINKTLNRKSIPDIQALYHSYCRLEHFTVNNKTTNDFCVATVLCAHRNLHYPQCSAEVW